jgi:hypothetical protein
MQYFVLRAVVKNLRVLVIFESAFIFLKLILKNYHSSFEGIPGTAQGIIATKA